MKEIKITNILQDGTKMEDMTNYQVPLNSKTAVIPDIIEAIKKRLEEKNSTIGIA